MSNKECIKMHIKFDCSVPSSNEESQCDFTPPGRRTLMTIKNDG